MHEIFNEIELYLMKYYLKRLLASIRGFTSDGLVFERILFSDHKPLASWLPFNVLFHFWLPLGFPLSEAKRFESGSQGMKIFNDSLNQRF